MRFLLTAVLLLVATETASASTLSLYPERSERDLLAAIDGRETWRPRVVLGHWRPYALPGVSLETLTLSSSFGSLSLSVGAAREEWGVFGAWRLRGSLIARRAALRLGLAAELDGIRGGGQSRGIHLLASGGEPLSISLRLPLASTPFARAASGLVGVAWSIEGWTLRGWRGGDGLGLALARGLGPLELELIARRESWQGFALSYRRRRWSLRFEERLHAWLGASHGLRLSLR